MFRIMSADEAISLVRDGDCICVNSFVGIESPVELHEALFRRYQNTHSPKHLTFISSAGFGVWDENRNAEGYIREGAVDRLICGHFGAMPSTKKIILENRFEAYNLPLGCISHAIRAQAGGLPGALSKVGLNLFVDPRQEGPGINQISTDSSFVKLVEVEGEEYLYYKLPKITVTMIKGTAADRKGNISFDDMYMSGDALSICQATKSNKGIVIVQVDRIVDQPSRPRNAIIPGCLVDAIVVQEPEQKEDALKALTGSFEIRYEDWLGWTEKLEAVTAGHRPQTTASHIIAERAARELHKEDIVNIGIGIPELIS
ncbi:MAG: malonate decarboxylase subunit alpha, partial [Clostridiales bacterium]|nr:malonate decarboxylase subunit alpha [Clostridiales bacterium]